MSFWDRRSKYLGHNKMNYGTQQCDFLGQEKLILGHHKIDYGTKQDHFLGYWKVILVYLGR